MKDLIFLSPNRILLVLGCLFANLMLFGQLSVSGGFMVINTGSNVVSTGLHVQNTGSATITNQGTLSTTTNITNASGATLNGNGLWQLGGNWVNAGTFTAGTSTVLFNGSGASTVEAGGAAFYKLHLNKTNNNLTLASAVTANDTIRFLADNNKIICAGFDFTAGSVATVVGADADNYFVTNGAGFLKRQALGSVAFAFPVGADTSTYNLLIIGENGTADDIGVRCMAQPLANGSTGSPITTDAVNTAWEITENVAGGSNLSVTAYWPLTDELSGFTRTDCGIARFIAGTDWDLPPSNMGGALGGDPYNRVRNNLTPGILAVMDDAFMNRVKLALRIMLQGPYNTTTMKMNDNLRTLAAFPLTAPTTYGAGKFVHTGWQPAGGYNINASVLTVTGDDAIVDWVFLWLKSPSNPATNLQSRVALLQKDGDVVDLDGVSPVLFPSDAGDYIVAAGHRNHLSVRSPNGPGIALNEATVTNYDFTTSMAQAFGTNPMKQVQTTPTPIFALWGGNTSVNNTVRATGPATINDYTAILSTLTFPTNIIPTVYSNSDVNMDGTVRATGPATINDYSKLLSILGTPTTIITEQQ
jgi:hypothetical protein